MNIQIGKSAWVSEPGFIRPASCDLDEFCMPIFQYSNIPKSSPPPNGREDFCKNTQNGKSSALISDEYFTSGTVTGSLSSEIFEDLGLAVGAGALPDSDLAASA